MSEIHKRSLENSVYLKDGIRVLSRVVGEIRSDASIILYAGKTLVLEFPSTKFKKRKKQVDGNSLTSFQLPFHFHSVLCNVFGLILVLKNQKMQTM